MSCLIYSFVSLSDDPVVLHSFPTRRSSDLCNGESIAFSGEAVFVTHIMPRPDGSVRANVHANTQGVSGVGLTTGALYQLIEAIGFNELLTPDNDTQHQHEVLNIVSHGNAPNFFIHVVETVHV